MNDLILKSIIAVFVFCLMLAPFVGFYRKILKEQKSNKNIVN